MERTTAEILAWLKSLAHDGARLRLDSRRVEPGDIFVAVPGARVDGRTYIRVAMARGAAGVLLEERPEENSGSLPAAPERHPIASLATENLTARLGEIAAGFYGDPTARMTGFAVTGTNGKTTTTHWIAELMTRAGRPGAVVGTIGCRLGGMRFEVPGLTTPDAVSFQGVAADLVAAGAEAFAVEASSIGLVQGRLSGTKVDVAVFTNLTRDHLDYHGTMDAYAEAKARLFAWPGLKAAVVNADDPEGVRMAKAALASGAELWTTSLEGRTIEGARHRVEARDVRPFASGMRFSLVLDGTAHPVEARIAGDFNVSNLLEAAAAVLAAGIPLEAVLPHLGALLPPAGRMQMIEREGTPLAVVDYSHTPDALEKALESLRPIAEHRGGRLWAVFGCGGDRDPGKRPMMGAAAVRLADRVLVTSDNPRSEDPEAIARDVLAGAPGAECAIDRREAIHRAMLEAAPEDVVLVAGKGHEDYQETAGVRHHFSDVEVVNEALNERRTIEFAKAARAND